MTKIRNIFPGGNTCYGFYSFYDYMVPLEVGHKYILKGGPGVGKSVLMKKIATSFSQQNYDLEYHWCSSDSNSLDGIVIGDNEICFLDGTSPHIVETKFSGAVDEIINLGRFLNRDLLKNNREDIVKLTRQIGRSFTRAYGRLKEANIAYTELKSYYEEAIDTSAIKRNIRLLADDFLQLGSRKEKAVRHLFPGAITPEGLINHLDTIITKDTTLFMVKGNPGTGIKNLFDYVFNLIEINEFYAEIFHNPFQPDEIDLILLPEEKLALVDATNFFFDYTSKIPSSNFKRQLDFNMFIDESKLDIYAKSIDSALNRIELGIKEAIEFIGKAKKLHDNLESYYVEAMDFPSLEKYQEQLIKEVEDFLY